jgi:hypothetical protein
MPEESINLSTIIKKYITTEFLTVATFLIYSWGLSYNYLYYNSFGINIIKYISLQETLIDTIIFIVIIGVFSLVFGISSYYTTLGIVLIKKKNRIRKYVSIKRRNLDYFYSFSVLWLFIMIVLYLMTALFCSIILKMDTSIVFKYLAPVSFISILISASLILPKFKLLFPKLKFDFFTYLHYTFIVGILIISIYRIANNQKTFVLKNKSNCIEIISLNTGITYTTNDSILYIGETSSTIFLYNKPLNNTIIINKSNVVQTQLINQASIKIKKE